ncbi:uncharacterized protein LODBEIA_P53620 [Lodderomyces beijingensis]|uniref:3',5'-cyclic-nucleotide phosphodiesterase n=1 Tax=Lodderomyces beijingensis TaxID=1775926 RepID=A0ABP0ZSN0_9ASCO
MGKLTEIIHQESKYQQSRCNLLDYYSDSESVDYYYHSNINITRPFIKFSHYNTIMYTKYIFQKLTNFLISHPHLDHVSSLVINSAGFATNNPPKQIYGSYYTIDSLQNHYFNGIVWPNMPDFDIVNLNQRKFKQVFHVGNYKIKMFPLSHGELNLIEKKSRHKVKFKNGSTSIKADNDDREQGTPVAADSIPPRRHSSVTTIPAGINDDDYVKTKIYEGFQPNGSRHNSSASSIGGNLDEEAVKSHYLSSAFLISRNFKNTTNDADISYLLVFGDFESDSISHLDYNLRIWQEIAPLVNKGQMHGIILECSNSFEIDENKLYGHLTPRHVIHELQQLASECQRIKIDEENEESQALKGLNIIINHVKEPILSNYRQIKDPRKQILKELNKLNAQENMGIQFSVALSGTSIII